ncbi:MAG: YqgE/AlgH family protein [Pseudoruegeria sp.]
MNETSEFENLSGKLLIAMPDMGDPRFSNSVVYLCDHSTSGSMGVIINKVATDVTMGELLEQLSINTGQFDTEAPVHFGGPVETNRGFVLHTSDYFRKGITLRVDEVANMTASLEVLQDAAEGDGPREFLMALGYAGWGEGQLEDEISQNGWLTCDPTHDILFSDDNAGKWTAALKQLGVNPLMLSSTAGHA